MTKSSPSRWQLVKLGLSVFGVSLCVSVAILATVVLLTKPLTGELSRSGFAMQNTIIVAVCLSTCWGLWKYLSMRIVQRHASSNNEQFLQAKLRVAFWSYLLGWGVVFANNILITMLTLQLLFKRD